MANGIKERNDHRGEITKWLSGKLDKNTAFSLIEGFNRHEFGLEVRDGKLIKTFNRVNIFISFVAERDSKGEVVKEYELYESHKRLDGRFSGISNILGIVNSIQTSENSTEVAKKLLRAINPTLDCGKLKVKANDPELKQSDIHQDILTCTINSIASVALDIADVDINGYAINDNGITKVYRWKEVGSKFPINIQLMAELLHGHFNEVRNGNRMSYIDFLRDYHRHIGVEINNIEGVEHAKVLGDIFDVEVISAQEGCVILGNNSGIQIRLIDQPGEGLEITLKMNYENSSLNLRRGPNVQSKK